jgi:2-polyprenyl-6-methoxyphenol hydroxylase-like FAD-dependent oxidoreductase
MTPPKGDVVWADNGRKVTESRCGLAQCQVRPPFFHAYNVELRYFLNAFADIVRFGYQTVFLEPQIVLQILFERLEDKSIVVLNSRVLRVEHSEKSVSIFCDNGDSYVGDIVLAADGVNRFIRSEMRRYAGLQSRALVDKDRQS